jgi:hypothetical protein
MPGTSPSALRGLGFVPEGIIDAEVREGTEAVVHLARDRRQPAPASAVKAPQDKRLSTDTK